MAHVDEDAARRAAAEAEVLRRTVDGMPEGLQIIGRDWRYLYLNPVAAQQGQRAVGDLIGKKMWEAYPGIDDTPLFVLLRRVMEEREPTSFENLFKFPDGVERWFDLRVQPVADGLCIHSIDIDDRKRVQERLEGVNRDLDTLIQARTRDLEKANHELEAFSYSVSHDLRAPLRSIDGFARILVEDHAPMLNSEGQRVVGVIQRSIRRMAVLIDSLLAFSRLGKQAIAPTLVDMNALAREVAGEARATAPARDITMDIGELPVVRGDAVLLRQLWFNLLENAVKYSHETPVVRIEVRSVVENDEIRFTVKDNGGGFDMQYLGKLFGVFERLDAHSEVEGNGIGLAFVRRIVERHGGRVWAEGELGLGATFGFALPKP